VIVRILGEGQYTVPEDHRAALAKLDDAIADAVDQGDEDRFGEALAALAAEVRSSGEALADDAFAPSDLVVPFADATLDETKALLADHGESTGSNDH
jgi:hypothetical protein